MPLSQGHAYNREEGHKGPNVTDPLCTNIAANYISQIPWSYSGQGIDMEGTAEKCDD